MNFFCENNMKLPNKDSTATPSDQCSTGATPPQPSRKRPLSAANGQVVPLRPPSRAPSALSWGQLCAPQIAIPDSRLHLTSSRPRSRFNSVMTYLEPCFFTSSLRKWCWLEKAWQCGKFSTTFPPQLFFSTPHCSSS